MKKKAMITGITGQDGAYLAQYLLDKGYKVYGTFRRVSTPNFWRLQYLGVLNDVELIPFDLLDQSSIIEAIRLAKPDEIYNLAAQSFVGASFEQPVATGEITGLGLTRILDTIRTTDPSIRFYQASSSEMFGDVAEVPQNEKTPLIPKSPYAAAKVYAHWVAVNYRKAYDLFVSCGILFNHESPLRGVEFVTRKITHQVALIKHGLASKLYLGNLEAKRDWGYAKDYVECMWLMLQQSQPDDYIVATGRTYSVREFVNKAFKYAGLDYKDYVETSEKYLRPTDVELLLGDPSKAVKELGWNPNKTSLDKLIQMMVDSDMKLVEIQKNGFNLFNESNINLFEHFKE
ncbi:MAG: GDP-mannose 4,6-dehydratase [Bacteroidetes bacterium]|nr:GDP-mannose 4,6-dehydratase [Bacteroidota bacterium]